MNKYQEALELLADSANTAMPVARERDIDKAVETLKEVIAERETWQDINTAPKDGTEKVLALYKKTIAAHSLSKKYEVKATSYPRVVSCSKKGVIYEVFVGWMHIPKPPE